MLKIARRGRSLSLRCYMSCMITVMFYVIFNLIKFHRTLHQPERKLIYHFAYPYDYEKSPNYEITFFIQMSCGAFTAIVNSSVDSFVSILVLHVCSQLINLRTTLNKTIDKLAEKSISSSRFRRSLTAIVVRHEHLIRSVERINNCYSTVLFIHMIAATFQLCFETFQIFTIITDKNANVSIIKMAFLVFYVTIVLTHLYFYCYSAERLLTESTNIAYGVYECKWYDIPSRDAKDLMFIVYRSKIPLKLTVGKFGIFSLEMFGTTVKSSMGYLSAFLSMSD
ncbi:odorant receptor 22c-like [Harpegnathos saltator]|uniref:odorant receptor 22c-like n=1 Tax=Harpegnathos saltator TaxID=610380 RepID=UPI000DBEE984|nr:odorant receptor 22c-like [Harpegnathos saltator]